MRPELHAFLAIVIVFVSGCTTIESGNGIAIQDFGPDLPDAISGEEVSFLARVKNTGSQTASKVYADLLGISSDWHGEQVGNGPRDNGEKLPEEEECRYTNGFSLLPPDPQYGTEGSSHICTWKYLAPQLPQGASLTYSPILRVYYAYQSETVKLVNILSRNQLRSVQDSGGALPSETVSQSRSPIKLDVETPGPVRASHDTVDFQIKITLTNLDSGTACYPNSIEECRGGNANWNRIKISIKTPPSMSASDCGDIILDLFKGMSNSITCTITAGGIDLGIPNQVTITVTADYMYIIDKQASISVSSGQSNLLFSPRHSDKKPFSLHTQRPAGVF